MKQHTVLAEGIQLIDTHLGHQTGLAAAYMLFSDQHAAFFDSGASYSVPYFLEALATQGLQPEQVEYIFVSHVHLDHFAGASHLLKVCKNATVIVHERGFRHCQNPEKLIQAAAEVYGGLDILTREFGLPEIIDETRLRIADFNHPITLGKKTIRLINTPGHAMHHYALYDEDTRTILSGDAFGLSYPCHTLNGAAFIVPTTSPSQFDPEQMVKTVDHLIGLNPLTIAVAHFSSIDLTTTGVAPLFALKSMIYKFAQIAERHQTNVAAIELALWEVIFSELKLQGSLVPESQTRARFKLDMRLNAQGLRDYYVRTHKKPEPSA